MPSAWTRGGEGDAYPDCDGLMPSNTPGSVGDAPFVSRPRNGGAQVAEAVPEGCGNAGGVDALPIADSWF
jgi:hypothetical protein